MIKHISKILFLMCTILMVSCIKDSEEFVPINGGEKVTTDIFGVVLDEDDNPVDGALIAFNGNTKFTNKFGVYEFSNVKVDNRHNFLNISKNGYFETTRTFRSITESTLIQKTQLLAKSFDHSFDASTGGPVSNDITTLTFSSNTIVDDATGADYTGEVLVAMKYIDPSEIDIARRMPGDLSAMNSEGVYSTLTSYGMNYVELQSPQGAKLQIKDGSTVNMVSKIPDVLRNQSPESIKLWYFDDVSGLWKEEGEAKKEGDTYSGDVTHFSCWNYDADEPSIILSGRVIDQHGFGVSGVHVWVVGAGQWGGGHGNTNLDGTFSGAVAKDLLLTIKIVPNGCGQDGPIYENEFGPFSSDTDIGDIVVELTESNSISITGTAIDCDGQPLSEGIASLGNDIYPIENGVLDINYVTCQQNSEKWFTAYDLESLKSSDPVLVALEEANDLGVVDVCKRDLRHITVYCDELDIDGIAYINPKLNFFASETKRYSAQSDTLGAQISFTYEDVENAINLGTFELTNGHYFFEGGPQGEGFWLVNGSALVTDYDDVENLVRGSYTMRLTDDFSSEEYDFYGTFEVDVQ